MEGTRLDLLRALLDEQGPLLSHEAISRCGNRRGLREQTGRLLESAFVEIATTLLPEVSVEIGAHEASFSERLKQNLPGVHALAFEANPFVHERHATRLRAPEIGVDYRHAAICGENGSVELRIPAKLAGVAIIPRSNRISSLLSWTRTEFEYEIVRVPASTLDSVFGPVAAGRSVAWIDAEGAQAAIFSGGRAFFSRVAAVYIEVERRQVWIGQSTDSEVAASLANFSLVPVMRDNLAASQFNEVYLRNEPAVINAALPSIRDYVDKLRGLTG